MGKKEKELVQSEELLKQAFDHANEEAFAKIVAVTEGMDLPVKHSEQMAWSVIDKAELYDEAEKKRRAEFKAWLLKRRIRNACIAGGILAMLLIALYIAGVFDAFLLKQYEVVTGWKSVSSGADVRAGRGSGLWVGENGGEEEWMDGADIEPRGRVSGAPSDFPEIDQELLDNTVNADLGDFCKKNGLALNEYMIEEQEEWWGIDKMTGKYTLKVRYVATCLDYGSPDDGTAWKPSYRFPGDMPELASNMCFVVAELWIYV